MSHVTYEVCHPDINGKWYRLVKDNTCHTIIKCGLCSLIQDKLVNSSNIERSKSTSNMSNSQFSRSSDVTDSDTDIEHSKPQKSIKSRRPSNSQNIS